MKTTFDQDGILYRRLQGSPLQQAVTGEVCQWKRPNGSTLEDIVINSLPIGDGSAQRGTSNVNVYVADIETGGGKMPDSGRMHVLAGLALQTLKEGYGPDYNFWLVNQGTIAEPETDQHYINFRIDFKFHNQN